MKTEELRMQFPGIRIVEVEILLPRDRKDAERRKRLLDKERAQESERAKNETT